MLYKNKRSVLLREKTHMRSVTVYAVYSLWEQKKAAAANHGSDGFYDTPAGDSEFCLTTTGQAVSFHHNVYRQYRWIWCVCCFFLSLYCRLPFHKIKQSRTTRWGYIWLFHFYFIKSYFSLNKRFDPNVFTISYFNCTFSSNIVLFSTNIINLFYYFWGPCSLKKKIHCILIFIISIFFLEYCQFREHHFDLSLLLH